MKNDNETSWGTIKKSIVGAISTIILAGGTWFATTLFNDDTYDDEIYPTEQVVVDDISDSLETDSSDYYK